MVEGTEPKGRGTIGVPLWVQTKIRDYQEALLREKNRRASYGDIIAALLDGISVAQADYMIGAYRPQQQGSDEPSDE